MEKDFVHNLVNDQWVFFFLPISLFSFVGYKKWDQAKLLNEGWY